MAGSLIESDGDLRDFVRRRIVDAGGEVSLGDAPGKAHDLLQATGDRLRSNGSQQSGKKQGDGGALHQFVAAFSYCVADSRERIGKAHRPVFYGRGNIEELDAESVAGARIAAGGVFQGPLKLRAGGMVLHGFRIGFRIGQHFAGGSNHGNTGVG